MSVPLPPMSSPISGILVTWVNVWSLCAQRNPPVMWNMSLNF